MSSNGVDAASKVRETIGRATLALDNEKWGDWLSLCDDEFHYSITAFSPEINKDMIYLQGSRKEMETLISHLPKHNTDHSWLRRHTSVYTVDVNNDEATAVSSFVIYMNVLDGFNSHIDAGESRLFLTGKYYDTFKLNGGDPKFVKREVRLDNRRLDKGSHWPL